MTLFQMITALCIVLACILACICSYKLGQEDGYLKRQEELDNEAEARIQGMYEAYQLELRERFIDDGYLPQDPPENWEGSEEDE